MCNNLLQDWASVSSHVKSVPREMPGRSDIEKGLGLTRHDSAQGPTGMKNFGVELV